MNGIVFRSMQIEDLPAVKGIEKESFTDPWSMQSYMNELLENHLAYYVVGMIKEMVVSYCGCWIVFDEAQITTIATHPQHRGKGLGEATLRYMMNYLQQKGAETLFLEVRISNHTAQGLYEKLGFKKMGIRKRYYADNQEDAIVMGVNLSGEGEGFARSWN